MTWQFPQTRFDSTYNFSSIPLISYSFNYDGIEGDTVFLWYYTFINLSYLLQLFSIYYMFWTQKGLSNIR